MDFFETDGILRVTADTGFVYVRRDDDGDIHWEPVGSMDDRDCCPEGMEEAWEALAAIWEDAGREGSAYRRTVVWTYENLCTPSRN